MIEVCDDIVPDRASHARNLALSGLESESARPFLFADPSEREERESGCPGET